MQKIQGWVRVDNTHELIIYVCFMIWWAFVAQLVQNGCCRFPETPLQFPLCHLEERNAKNKTKKIMFQQNVILHACACVEYKRVLLKENISIVWFFPHSSERLCSSPFYCNFSLFFAVNPLHSLSFNWRAHQMTEDQVELFLKHWIFISW